MKQIQNKEEEITLPKGGKKMPENQRNNLAETSGKNLEFFLSIKFFLASVGVNVMTITLMPDID